MYQNKLYAVLYLVTVISGIIGVICMTTVWLYWQRALDTNFDGKFSCILYGKWTFSAFTGGDATFCRFVTFSGIPVIMWSSVMFLYHIVKLHRPQKGKERIFTNTKGRRVMYKDQRPLQTSNTVLTVCLVAGVLFSILTFSSAVVLSDGFYKTCKEYKKSILSQLSASGELAELILGRISCIATTDFMDYLQPDPPNLEYKFRRTFRMNTGASIIVAMLSIWLNFLTFLFLVAFTILLICKRKSNKRPISTEEARNNKKLISPLQ